MHFDKPKTRCDLMNNQPRDDKMVKVQEMTPRSGWKNTRMGQGLARNKHHFGWCKEGESLPFEYI